MTGTPYSEGRTTYVNGGLTESIVINQKGTAFFVPVVGRGQRPVRTGRFARPWREEGRTRLADDEDGRPKGFDRRPS